MMIYFLTIFALLIRLYGINWDQGLFLHPDEKLLIRIANKLKFFPYSRVNFYSHTPLPIYILKGFSSLIYYLLKTDFNIPSNLLYLGRIISVMADTLNLLLIYKLSKLLFEKTANSQFAKKASILSAFFYAFTFFPIQNSHFFIPEVFLTLFSTLLFFLLLKFLDKNKLNTKDVLLLALVSAAITSTKILGIIFVVITESFLVYKAIKKKGKRLSLNFDLFLKNILLFNFSFLTLNFAFMPYVFIFWGKLSQKILLQIKFNPNFSLYHLKNIFFWGAGPVLSLLSILGIYTILKEFRKVKHSAKKYLFLFFLFYGLYFIILGNTTHKMGDILPIYSAIATLPSYAFYFLIKKTNPKIAKLTIVGTITLHLFYLSLFLSIYSKPHTKIQATEWILKNVPYGSKIALEHWDDKVPVYGENLYKFLKLETYSFPDNIVKWKKINSILYQADYLIIVTQRTYNRVQKLLNCRKDKICYPKTNAYYQKLLGETSIWTEFGPIKFKKIAEFANYPSLNLPFIDKKIQLRDDWADESFTVYDHPRIIIFKLERNITAK